MKRLPIFMRTVPAVLAGLFVCGQANGAVDKAGPATAPTIVAPENNKVFQKQQGKDPIVFKWAAVAPPPAGGEVVYHLEVWQVPTGKTPIQAARAGKPIAEKNIDNATETSLPSSSLPRGPNNTFVWTVEAANKEGKVYGVSAPAIFSVQSADITITAFSIKCGSSFGTYTYTLTVTNFGTNPFVITSLAFSGGSISSVTYSPPPVGKVVNTGTGNAVTFTGGFTSTYPATIYATVSGNQVGNINLTSTDTDAADLDACVCSACNGLNWQAGNSTQTLQGNSIKIIQPFNPAGLGNIVAVKAEIISFARYVDDTCMTCTKDWNEWGNFTAGTFANVPGTLGAAVAPVTGSTHHSMYWSSTGSLPQNGSFNLTISTPPLSNLTCCCDRVIVSIRYTYTFRRPPPSGVCATCSVVRTYALRKGNCPADDALKQPEK